MTTSRKLLSSLSPFYTLPNPKNAGILLKPIFKTLEFYPRGYTEMSIKDGINRQDTLKYLWDLSVFNSTEEEDFPFSQLDHNIVLECINFLIPNCIRITIQSSNPQSRFFPLHNRELGWVPQRISRVLSQNLDMITGGRILKIKANWHKKYYTSKIILGYDGKFQACGGRKDGARFSNIMDEIQ